MFLLRLFSVFLFYKCGIVLAKQCSDCIALSDCPAALWLAHENKTENTKKMFRGSVCGYVNVNSGHMPIPKVCCLDFGTLPETTEERIAAPYEEDEIEVHPNLALLPEKCGDTSGYRIVGGTIATIYEFPWMALIAYHTSDGIKFRCSGSIINSRYILTAGHCVDRSRKVAGVRVGEFNIRQKRDCQGVEPVVVCESHIQDLRIENDGIILHPSGNNDIALVRVQKPINFLFKNVKPICLPVSKHLRNKRLGGTIATVAGWGLTEHGNDSTVLLKVQIPIQTGSSCRDFRTNETHGDSINELTEFCAGTVNKDSCSGDSGGPLMIEENYRGSLCYVQYGIVSRGPYDCAVNYPGVYTDVTKFMGWILDTIKE